MAQTLRYHQSFHYLYGIHFISATTHHRTPYFSDDQMCLTLRQQIMFYSQLYQIDLLSFVIMPDHLHCMIWPQGEKTFSDFMRGVKSFSGKKILEELNKRGLGTPLIKTSNRRGVGTPPIVVPPFDHRLDSQIDRRGPLTPPLSHTPPVRKIWQDSFFTYYVDSISKLEEKLEYIKQNPVKAGLVSTSEKYKWLYVNPKINEIEF